MANELTVKVEGMSCMHCKMAVEKALKAVPGVTGVQVDLDKNQAVVTGSAEKAAVVKAIEDAGYKANG